MQQSKKITLDPDQNADPDPDPGTFKYADPDPGTLKMRLHFGSGSEPETLMLNVQGHQIFDFWFFS